MALAALAEGLVATALTLTTTTGNHLPQAKQNLLLILLASEACYPLPTCLLPV
jgi:hypothetical protein